MPLDHELTPARVRLPDPSQLIVFSDLDGTLLDHETYSHAAAAESLARLREHKAPLILASSKTAAEIAPLRDELGFSRCEAIVENGAGILEPHDSGDGASEIHGRLLSAIAGLPPELADHFRGFSDWSDEDVSERTGLSTEQAARARQRQFSEPGLWSGTDEARDAFLAGLGMYGVRGRSGGRFLTLSLGRTKADATRELAREMGATRTIALGDAPNDIEMLQTADIGVVVRNDHGPGLPLLEGEDAGRILRTDLPGPAGWAAAVLSLLDDYDAKDPAHG